MTGVLELVAQQAQEIARLNAHILRQDARIAELERQLASTSRNSSKPPSSDGLAKPAPKSLRGKSGLKPGGQPGHQGKTLSQVADPDAVLRHEPACCQGCGAGLADATEAGVARRQVFDLPPIDIHVTEHQLVSRRCRCGTVTRAKAPCGAGAPVQYGPRMLAGNRVPLHGPIPLQEAHRPSTWRTLRHTDLTRHGVLGDRPRRRGP